MGKTLWRKIHVQLKSLGSRHMESETRGECSKLRWPHGQRPAGEECRTLEELKETQSVRFSAVHTTSTLKSMSFAKLCQHIPYARLGRWVGGLCWEEHCFWAMRWLHLGGAQGQVWARLLAPLSAITLVFPCCSINCPGRFPGAASWYVASPIISFVWWSERSWLEF